MFGRTEALIRDVRLSSKFDFKVLGQTCKLSGVEFEYSNRSVQIHQCTITEVYEHFKSFKPLISSLPIVKGANCLTDNLTQVKMSKLPYRNVIECFSFISGFTRSDIALFSKCFYPISAKSGIYTLD